MSEFGTDLKDTLTKLFSQEVTREFLHAREGGEWAGELWNLVEEIGLCDVLLSEEEGGVGGDWDDAYEIAKTCGRYAVPLPIPETMLARWLLTQGTFDRLEGPGTILLSTHEPERVPWGRNAKWAVAMDGAEAGRAIAAISLNNAQVDPEENLAKEPRDLMQLEYCEHRTGATQLPGDAFTYLGALIRSAQLAGAALALTEKTVQYSSERIQFGRPLNKMQAIQQNIARLATATSSLDAVSRTAFRRFQSVGFSNRAEKDARLSIAVAKYRGSHCADLICSLSHQIHGAIGFTHEHDLHFFTRRMWSWRSEFGNAGYWSKVLGEYVVATAGTATWNLVTSCTDNSKS